MANNIRGAIVRQGNFLRIDNAFVEDVTFSGRNSGSLLVSYSVPRPNGITTVEQLRLNVSNRTVVLSSVGLPMCFCDIRRGMWINATFSQAMTRSIPPQANAFLIVARQSSLPTTNTTTARVARVDASNNLLYTGSPNNINRQTRYVVTNSTLIQNRNGFPINLRALRPGQMVRITHANFQTASIPPQTTAYRIQVL